MYHTPPSTVGGTDQSTFNLGLMYDFDDTTAPFVGYLLGGAWGAADATVAIFPPTFFFVAVIARALPYLRRSVLRRWRR